MTCRTGRLPAPGLAIAAAGVALAATLSLALPVAADDAALAEGRAIAEDRNRGNCFSCHMAEGAEMAGNYGPPLMMMQQRYPDRQVLKQQIADPRVRNPNTVMPPYGAHGILTDRELELVVDYVHSL
jgi:sulfur-oxidizing protein SoxX